MERQLLRTSAILVVMAAVGALLLMRQARRLARIPRVASVMSAAALPPPTDSASFVAHARAAHDADRRVRGVEPRAVRVAVYEPDSAGVLLRLEPEPRDTSAAVWVRVLHDGSSTVTPHRP